MRINQRLFVDEYKLWRDKFPDLNLEENEAILQTLRFKHQITKPESLSLLEKLKS